MVRTFILTGSMLFEKPAHRMHSEQSEQDQEVDANAGQRVHIPIRAVVLARSGVQAQHCACESSEFATFCFLLLAAEAAAHAHCDFVLNCRESECQCARKCKCVQASSRNSPASRVCFAFYKRDQRVFSAQKTQRAKSHC